MRVGRVIYFSESRRAGKIIDINYQKINFYLDFGAKIPCKNDLVVFIIRMEKNGLEAQLIGQVIKYTNQGFHTPE